MTADTVTDLHGTTHDYEFDDPAGPLSLPLPLYPVSSRTPSCAWPIVYALSYTPADGLVSLVQTATHIEFSTDQEAANFQTYSVKVDI